MVTGRINSKDEFTRRAKVRHDRISKALVGSGRGADPSTLGKISFYGLLATILLSAIPYGSVEVWHKSALVLMIAVFAGFRVIDSAFHGSFRISNRTLLLPLLGILSLAFAQVVRWPGMSAPISMDPYETRAFILIFGAVLVAAEVLFFYTDSRNRLVCLIVLVLAVGLGSAVFGLVRDIVLDQESGLVTTYFSHEQGYAQFINRNHFALLIEMSLGLLLGILIRGEFSEKLKFLLWLAAGGMGYSLIAASSRGGLVSGSALCLFAIAAHMMTRERVTNGDRQDRRRVPLSIGMIVRRISLTAGLLAVVFSFIVFAIAFVGGDAVATRFEKVKGEFETVNNTGVNRNLIWNATWEMIKTKPLLGVGFGGYGVAITKFDTSGGKYSLQQAHNDYLEILSNGGIVGLALFCAFGILVPRDALSNLKDRDAFIRSSAFGAMIGIFGVLIHSFVDFGLHIPVNALVFSVLVVIATVNIRNAVDPRPRFAPESASRSRL